MKIKLLLLLLLPILAFAQKQTAFEKRLKATNLNFFMPKDFIFSDSAEVFMPFRGLHLSLSECKLISKKSDLIIYTTVITYDTAGTDFIQKKFNPKYDRNNNYLKLIRSKIDSTKTTVRYFGSDTLSKLKASEAGIYTMRLEKPYKDKFDKAKVVFLTKRNVGDVEMIYFYKDRADIDRYIKKTLFTFKFAN